MSLLSDREIGFYAVNRQMITPFEDHLVSKQDGEKVVSYGLSSYGYDVRCADEFLIFQYKEGHIIDPLAFNDRICMYHKGKFCDIPPNGFILCRSYEYIKMPSNVSGLVLGKSTYARCGVSNLATPLEAGWEGNITLEFANCTPNPIRIYSMQGVAQVLFLEGHMQCSTTYADRKGKYQGQTGITLPR